MLSCTLKNRITCITLHNQMSFCNISTVRCKITCCLFLLQSSNIHLHLILQFYRTFYCCQVINSRPVNLYENIMVSMRTRSHLVILLIASGDLGLTCFNICYFVAQNCHVQFSITLQSLKTFACAHLFLFARLGPESYRCLQRKVL